MMRLPKEKKLYKGLDKWYHILLGKFLNRYSNIVKISSFKKRAHYIHQRSLEYQELSDEAFEKKIFEVKKVLRLHRYNKRELDDAVALVVELIYRQKGQRAYEVQIMGALAIIERYIIQMATGEGKTLTAAIAAVILGWRGNCVHIITANDYLAQRDAQDFECVYNKALLKSGFITQKSSKEERGVTYKYDIVYSTSKEVVADFLKDKLLFEKVARESDYLLDRLLSKDEDQLIFRGFDVVIVDEADSVLADDAITPLIISTKLENGLFKESIKTAHQIAQHLQKDEHYRVDLIQRDILFTAKGLEKIEKLVDSLSSFWKMENRREFLIKQVLIAREFFHLNKDYIIEANKIAIVDEKSGRVMEDRSWSQGLHQAIELKEGVEMSDPTVTLTKMSFQRFFRLYRHIAGMSGTLQHLEDEFWSIYGTQVLKIPTRLPSKRIYLKDRLFIDKNHKYRALIEFVEELSQKKIPILVSANSIEESEYLFREFQKRGIIAQVLNALYDEMEASIIQEAGKMGQVTIATNMAGRGTDIKIDEDVEKAGGLYTILSERNSSKRIDMQFFGRCARQGERGVAIAFMSLDDSVVQNCLSQRIIYLLKRYFHFPYIAFLSRILYYLCQKHIEKKMVRMRNKILLHDIQMEEAMSYTYK